MDLKYYDELSVPHVLLGFRNEDVVRVWKLKRDNSTRFCLTSEGKIYIVGDTEIVSKMTDAELLEGMTLGPDTETAILYSFQMCVDSFEQVSVDITPLPFFQLRQVYDSWIILVTMSHDPISAAKYLVFRR